MHNLAWSPSLDVIQPLSNKGNQRSSIRLDANPLSCQQMTNVSNGYQFRMVARVSSWYNEEVVI